MSVKKSFVLQALTYSAICIALATLLAHIKLFSMPFGGSVTAFSMLFIVLVGYWFGPVAGILAGIAHGLLGLAISPYVIHPAQFLLDYPLAFGMLGVSGFFRNQKYGLVTGYTVACLLRWLMSFLSGVIFFASYAPEGMNPMLYSALYNFSYILPEMIITIVILFIPAFQNALNQVKRRLL